MMRRQSASDSLQRISNASMRSNALSLARESTSANPRQPPMPRSVTPPADGAECGFADRIEIAPQESRLGGSTAVARPRCSSLAARSSHAPAHAAVPTRRRFGGQSCFLAMDSDNCKIPRVTPKTLLQRGEPNVYLTARLQGGINFYHEDGKHR